MDADAYLTRACRGPGERSGLLDEGEAGADGSLGVVLVDGGDAEDGRHGLALEPLHHAPVGLDDAARHGVVGPHGRIHVLGVGVLRVRR